MPSVNYVQTGRAQGAVFGTIANALDRMSEFATKQAEQEAITTGAEFGVANAPTPEQLKMAGEDAEKHIPGYDSDTLFGKAAKKAALQTVQAGMETATRNEITALRLAAIEQDMPVAEFSQKVQNAINGYTSAMAEVSPSAAVNFSAGMAANANSAVLSYAEKLSAKQTKQAKIDAEVAADTIISGAADDEPGNSSIDDAFAAGSTPATSTQAAVPLGQKLDLLRKQVELAAAGGGAEMVRAKLKAFDAAVQARYVQTVSDWAMTNPAAAMRELSTSQIKDARIQDVWSNMNADQRRAAGDDILKRMSAQLSLESQIEAKRERKRAELAENTVVEIARARLAGDEEKVNDGLDQLALYDGDKYASLSETIRQGGNLDEPSVINMLEIASLNGTLSQTLVMNAYSNGKISNTTFVSMLEKVDAQRNDDHTQAMKYARAKLVPEALTGTILSGADKSHKEAAKSVADIEAALILEVRRNPGVNRLEFVKPLVDAEFAARAEATKSENRAKANKILNDLKKRGLILKDATVDDAINYLNDEGQAAKAKQLEVLL